MAADRRSDGDRDDAGSRAEQIVARALEPLGAVMLTRERIHETLEEAVRRGRVTRTDANELTGELLRRGRQQTSELLAELERARREGVSRLARTADLVRSAGGKEPEGPQSDEPPLPGYDSLTARQVQARLGGLRTGQLRALVEYERRHANRKTVLDSVERALG
jgi:polyhydroxyalkanoate synthesis regulator phasin